MHVRLTKKNSDDFIDLDVTGQEITIGRKSHPAFFSDRTISSAHCKLSSFTWDSGSELTIEDCSTNGTVITALDGIPNKLGKQETGQVYDGNTLTLGDAVFVVEIKPAATITNSPVKKEPGQSGSFPATVETKTTKTYTPIISLDDDEEIVPKKKEPPKKEPPKKVVYDLTSDDDEPKAEKIVPQKQQQVVKALSTINSSGSFANSAPSQSATSCKLGYWVAEYNIWKGLSTADKQKILQNDPMKYVVLRAIDMRRLYSLAHDHGACYCIAVGKDKRTGKNKAYMSQIGGDKAGTAELLHEEIAVFEGKDAKDEFKSKDFKDKKTNKYHAEMVMKRYMDKQIRHIEFIASATTIPPCDKNMFPKNNSHCRDTFLKPHSALVPKVIAHPDNFIKQIANDVSEFKEIKNVDKKKQKKKELTTEEKKRRRDEEDQMFLNKHKKMTDFFGKKKVELKVESESEESESEESNEKEPVLKKHKKDPRDDDDIIIL